MTKRKQRETAEEFLTRLEADPEYQALTRKKEAEWAAAVAKNRKEEAPLVAELRDAGVHVRLMNIPGEEYEGSVRSVDDLVNTNARYPNAIPILVRHLQKDYGRDIKEGIARALIVPEARGTATAVLIDEFCMITDPNSGLKWVLGVAIAETSTIEFVQRIVELVTDKAHGKSREDLPLALRLLPKQEAKPILEQLVDDPDVREQAIRTLKILSAR